MKPTRILKMRVFTELHAEERAETVFAVNTRWSNCLKWKFSKYVTIKLVDSTAYTFSVVNWRMQQAYHIPLLHKGHGSQMPPCVDLTIGAFCYHLFLIVLNGWACVRTKVEHWKATKKLNKNHPLLVKKTFSTAANQDVEIPVDFTVGRTAVRFRY